MKQLLFLLLLIFSVSLIASQTMACSHHSNASGGHNHGATSNSSHGNHQHTSTIDEGESLAHNGSQHYVYHENNESSETNDENTNDFFDFDDETESKANNQNNHENHLHAPVGQ